MAKRYSSGQWYFGSLLEVSGNRGIRKEGELLHIYTHTDKHTHTTTLAFEVYFGKVPGIQSTSVTLQINNYNFYAFIYRYWYCHGYYMKP